MDIIVEVVVVIGVPGDSGARIGTATSLATVVEHVFGGESNVGGIAMTGADCPKGLGAWRCSEKLTTCEDIAVIVVWNGSNTVQLVPKKCTKTFNSCQKMICVCQLQSPSLF